MTNREAEIEARDVLSAICKDSLECSLDKLLTHRDVDYGATSALFFRLSDLLDALAAEIRVARQERDRALDAAEGALASGDAAVVGWTASADALAAARQETETLREALRELDERLASFEQTMPFDFTPERKIIDAALASPVPGDKT